MFEDVLVIIPAYNEEQVISDVIKGLKNEGFMNIVVVNDGSSDNTKYIAESADAKVLSHPVNIGLGGAIYTGFEYAKKCGYKYALTCDGDGQHLASDVTKVAVELSTSGYDVVIGSRLHDMKRKNYPRYIVNICADILTFLVSGKYNSDTQSGLRGFRNTALDLIQVGSSGYEISSEILISAVQNKLRIKTIPVKCIYTKYSQKKGQQILSAVRVFMRLLSHKIVSLPTSA